LPRTFFEFVFFFTIFGISILSIVLIKLYANESSWRELWTEIKGKGLTIHHGSIQVLSEKVATKHERMADSLPSVMLIIGLLGTFVGLGLALNKASLIITQGGSSNMEGAMTELMQMMQGLGTKFKTSSWGIIGYLSFGSWIAHNGYESKRLAFCANMIRDELDQNSSYNNQIKSFHIEQSRTEKQNGENILRMLNELQATRDDHQKYHQEIQTYSNQIKQLHVEKLRTEKQNGEYILRVITELQATRDSHQQNHIIQLKELQNINHNMSSFEKLGDAAIRIENSANTFTQTAHTLDKTVKSLSSSITQTFDLLQKSIRDILEKTATNLTGASDRISSTTDHMSDRLQITLSDIQNGLNNMMMQSNQQLIASSTQLQSMIQGMETTIANMREGVLGILAETSKSMNTSINTLNADMRKILTQLEEHINTSMSHIGLTIQNFTGSVGHLLGEVETNLEGAMSMQTDAVKRFQNSVNDLQSELSTTLETTRKAILLLEGHISHLTDARDLFISSQKENTKNLLYALIGDNTTSLSSQLTHISTFLELSQKTSRTDLTPPSSPLSLTPISSPLSAVKQPLATTMIPGNSLMRIAPPSQPSLPKPPSYNLNQTIALSSKQFQDQAPESDIQIESSDTTTVTIQDQKNQQSPDWDSDGTREDT